MSGPARTAEVRIDLSFKITARATESEMVGFAHEAIDVLGEALTELAGQGSKAEVRAIRTTVATIGEPGGSL